MSHIVPARMAFGSLLLWLLGLAGAALIIALTPINPETIASSGLSEQAVRLWSFFNNAFVLALAVAGGTMLAGRVGLQSIIVQAKAIRSGFHNAAARAVLIGLGLGFMLYAIDWSLFRFVPNLHQAHGIELTVIKVDWPDLIARTLYGGLSEEIMMRWGLMTVLAWVFLKLIPHRDAAMWTAVALAALIFGIGHLPALGQIVADVPPTLMARTVCLNFLGGMVFGYLFWKHNIEIAITAHAATHIGMAAAQGVIL
ncbi:MAG: type II CAAX prenyl endopeptidase Rce1 family protein [Sphingomonadales bacterium]